MGADQDRLRPPLCWEFFDKIYCITLDSRPDRRAEAAQQFAAVGLGERIEFFSVAKDTEDPARGIYQSHMRCLSRGLEAGARNILVFEDDVFFRGFSAQRLAAACRFLQDTETWDAFFLGALTSGSTPTAQAAVVRVQYRCLSHAYALSRACAERMTQEKWRGIPIDSLIRRTNSHFFALSPMCAFQGLARSDNGTVVIDTVRNLFGGLAFIQRCNELYQHNKGLVIALHLLVAVVVIALFTLFRP